MILFLIILSFKLFLIFVVFALILILLIKILHFKLKWQHTSIFGNTKTISFVHPFCADCGGGEKVLWRMVTSLISHYESIPLSNIQSNQKKLKKHN